MPTKKILRATAGRAEEQETDSGNPRDGGGAAQTAQHRIETIAAVRLLGADARVPRLSALHTQIAGDCFIVFMSN